jgi:hypothetical protein
VGPSREWYSSWHLKEERSGSGPWSRHETFYADGRTATLVTGEGDHAVTRVYYVGGQLAVAGEGGTWQAYQLDGRPVAD